MHKKIKNYEQWFKLFNNLGLLFFSSVVDMLECITYDKNKNIMIQMKYEVRKWKSDP